MTWQAAQDVAQTWVDRLQLSKARLAAEHVALDKEFERLPFSVETVADRYIVFSGATRIIRKRGGQTNLMALDPATALPRTAED